MNQHRIYKLIVLLLTIATISGCGAAVESPPSTHSPNSSDLTPLIVESKQPTISSTSPANNAIDVAVNTSITVVFSKAMKSSTISTATFILDNGVTGKVTYSDTNATFTPSVNLEYSTKYTATITVGVQDLDGNGLASNYIWEFTTGINSDITLPTVSLTSPENDVTDVPVNTSIITTFSESMKPSTITKTTFTLDNGAIGTVTYSGTTATYTPLSNLKYSTNYTATISTEVQDSAGNLMAPKGGSTYKWRFTTGRMPDTTPPTISSTIPENGAINVSVNSAIIATFSEPMAVSSISTNSFQVIGVAGAVTYSGTTATFTPMVNLTYSTTYTAIITTKAKDATGNALASNYSWTFRTGVAPDTTPPTISSTNPVNGSTDVSVNSTITATFSEPMDASTITTATFILDNGVPGVVSYSGTTATFNPLSNLAYSTTYTAIITTEVKDSARNALASGYTWSFTTGVAPDTILPTISSTSPAIGATSVSVNSTITATFSEVMEASTISTATFTLDTGVSGAVSYSGTTATFNPLSNLAYSTTYTAIITTSAKDAAGNALASNYSWTFRTGVAPDTTPPTISSTIPTNNATGVSVNSAITATFSETMEAYTISSATFKLDNGVTGTVTYSGTTATLNPLTPLQYSTTYIATISTEAKDSAENALASGYTWSFTTGVAQDTTSPTISSTSPVNGATDVSVNSAITATFSENIKASTISTASFSIDNGVTGSVIYSGTTATFTPSVDLAYLTTYTATITNNVQDGAGNALTSNYSWTFRTGVAPDTTPPTILSTSPANGATGISVTGPITSTFSENMAVSTITTNTYTLDNGATGSVTYSGTTATFSPLTNLAYSTTYTALIKTGVQDTAGNTIVSNYTWTFKTGISSLTLSWNAPTTNADGSAIYDLAGYKIYYGTVSRNYTSSVNVGNVVIYNFSSLPNGIYYFSITAYDTHGNESNFSNEVSKIL